MRNNPFTFFILFISIIAIIDFFSYRGVKKLLVNRSKKTCRVVNIFFWIIPFLLFLELLSYFLFYKTIRPADFLIYFHFISGTFILFYTPKLIFILFNLFDDIYHSLKYKFGNKRHKELETQNLEESITRSEFLTRSGIILAGIPFFSILYGIKWGRFNYTIRSYSLDYTNLPSAFNGFKIVQISDFHIGSFAHSSSQVLEAVIKINELEPDLLLFTGDFVNNVSTEMDIHLEHLKLLKANLGKFSILGNHDYGDYIPWKSQSEKKDNLHRLIEVQNELGFDVLLNESRKIQNKQDQIEIIGVENWGLPPFPQYGDLNRAMEKVDKNLFKILMSHDPTHWDEQVLKKTDIDLTLSGHTHGAQFGIEIPGWRWSPVNLRYKRWGGLYQEKNQDLYVNTGIGFIAFPGRVGMPPEITVIELKRA